MLDADALLKQALKMAGHHRLALAAVLFGAIGLWAGGHFVVTPDLQKIKALKKESQNIELKRDSLAGLIRLENGLKKYSSFFANTRDVSWVVDVLNGIAKETGVEITSFAPRGESRLSDYQKISLSVVARGQYHALGDFLSRVEQATPQIRLSDLSLQIAGGGEKD